MLEGPCISAVLLPASVWLPLPGGYENGGPSEAACGSGCLARRSGADSFTRTRRDASGLGILRLGHGQVCAVLPVLRLLGVVYAVLPVLRLLDVVVVVAMACCFLRGAEGCFWRYAGGLVGV